ncbi:solute carrier family 25 member 46-like [Patiria miniata]|uniref:Solute carrier family 25 member 46 n=1 Tax=Patiria miniata TaxID=46514 RepID=A0A914B9F0_PATMI|nr:solute carrier family 25 member 46-like [Patiria miniata]
MAHRDILDGKGERVVRPKAPTSGPHEMVVTEMENSSAPKQDQTEILQRFAGLGLGIATLLTENVLSHPFIVFRRQCQVNHHAYRYHLQPFSVVQVIVNLQRHQGIATMWKGLGSAFVVQGIGLGSETVISELTPLAKEIHVYSTIKQLCGHLALKAIGAAITMPFVSASLVEVVQSDIASERPGVFDCIKEGLYRLLGWGIPQTANLLPMYSLLLPTVLHSLLKYILSSVVQFVLLQIMRRIRESRDSSTDGHSETLPAPKSVMEEYFPQLLAAFAGNFVTDALLYPLETVTLRLHLQGTRTIIDNTDHGYGVIPISTRYGGFFECWATIVADEGTAGLYKGFGALLLQYALHAAILKVIQVIFTKLAEDFSIGVKKESASQ